jgi:hypothetical protein
MNILRMSLLAQEDQGIGAPLMWSLILIVMIVLLFGGVVVYRKWMNSDDTTSGEGLTLSDLRRFHKAGQMTDEEFEKAKAILIGSVKGAGEKESDKPKGGPRTIPPGSE